MNYKFLMVWRKRRLYVMNRGRTKLLVIWGGLLFWGELEAEDEGVFVKRWIQMHEVLLLSG